MSDQDIHTCSYSCERPACIRAQRDALRADAERYRYLRDVWGGVQSIAQSSEHRACIQTPQWRGDFDTVDAAIDAARAQEPQA